MMNESHSPNCEGCPWFIEWWKGRLRIEISEILLWNSIWIHISWAGILNWDAEFWLRKETWNALLVFIWISLVKIWTLHWDFPLLWLLETCYNDVELVRNLLLNLWLVMLLWPCLAEICWTATWICLICATVWMGWDLDEI